MYKIHLIIILLCSLNKLTLSIELNNVCDQIKAEINKDVIGADNESVVEECSAIEFVATDGEIIAEFDIESASDDDTVFLFIFEGVEEDSYVYKIDVRLSDRKDVGSHTIKVKTRGTGSIGYAALVGQVSRNSSIKIKLLRFVPDEIEEKNEMYKETNVQLYNLVNIFPEAPSSQTKDTESESPIAVYPFAFAKDFTNENSNTNPISIPNITDTETYYFSIIESVPETPEAATATESPTLNPTTPIVTVPFPIVTDTSTASSTTPIVTVPFPIVTETATTPIVTIPFPIVTETPTTPIVTVPFPIVTETPTTPIVTIPFPIVTETPTVTETDITTESTTDYTTSEYTTTEEITPEEDEEAEGLTVFLVVIISLSAVLGTVLIGFGLYWFLLSGKSLDYNTNSLDSNKDMRRQTSRTNV